MNRLLRATLLAAALALPCAGPAAAQTAARGGTGPAAGPARPGPPSGTAMPTVGVPAASVPGAGAAAQGQTVNINTASAQQLDALPGIGPARAKAIIQGRPYRDTAELLNRKIIPRNAYAGIKDRISVR